MHFQPPRGAGRLKSVTMSEAWVPPGPLPGGVIQYPFESRWEANSRGLAQVRQQDEGAAYAARDSQAAGSCWDWQAQLNISFLMVLS